jgi:hypothetical protein
MKICMQKRCKKLQKSLAKELQKPYCNGSFEMETGRLNWESGEKKLEYLSWGEFLYSSCLAPGGRMEERRKRVRCSSTFTHV